MQNNFKLKYKKNLIVFFSVIVFVTLLLVVIIHISSSKTKTMKLNNADSSINNIQSNKVVCVGKIEIIKGSEFLINITSEFGSNIFVALNELDNITNAQGIEWKQYHGNKGKEIETKFTDTNIGTFYVYVGSKGNSLKNVLVSIDNTDNTTPSNLNINDSNITKFEDINFSIDSIPSKEVVCIGKIELKSGSNFFMDVSVKSGKKIFVALNESDSIVNAQGVEWKQYYEVAEKEIQKTFTDVETGTFYVYVGNKGDGLKDVVVTLSSVN